MAETIKRREQFWSSDGRMYEALQFTDDACAVHDSDYQNIVAWPATWEAALTEARLRAEGTEL